VRFEQSQADRGRLPAKCHPFLARPLGARQPIARALCARNLVTRSHPMPKPLKILILAAIGYLGLIVAFESMIGILQPDAGTVLTITTTDHAGESHNRVLARLEDDGRIYVSANHWPRAWYREALANPDVQASIEGARANYLAVPIEDGGEHERLDRKFAHPFLFRLITGFPPRHFLRLDPK
jgi:hypothetical protein